MVQPGKNLYLLLDGVKMLIQFRFVHHFDRNDVLLIVLVVGFEYFSKGSRSEYVRVLIYLIILLQFFGTLLLV